MADNPRAKIITREVDRISALPDAIVLDILSLLTTEDAVRTCVLSKRWQYLWTSVPTLTFSLRNLDYPKLVGKRKCRKFISFIRDVLTQCHHSKLQRFQLGLPFEHGFAAQLKLWIRYAVGANVEELDLYLPCYKGGRRFQVPQHVFTNGFLTNLKLGHCIMAPNGHVNLKLLKNLSLSRMVISEDVLCNIVSGSPALESLQLHECYGFSRLHINSVSIRNLVFKAREDDKYLKISAPNIVSLDIRGYVRFKKIVLDVPSLIEANRDFYICCRANDNDTWKGLVEGLHNVTKLVVGHRLMEGITRLGLEGYPISLPMCKWLKISSVRNSEYQGLANLMRNSPYLENLSLTSKAVGYFLREHYLACRNMEFKCIQQNLKTAQILYTSDGTKNANLYGLY